MALCIFTCIPYSFSGFCKPSLGVKVLFVMIVGAILFKLKIHINSPEERCGRCVYVCVHTFILIYKHQCV